MDGSQQFSTSSTPPLAARQGTSTWVFQLNLAIAPQNLGFDAHGHICSSQILRPSLPQVPGSSAGRRICRGGATWNCSSIACAGNVRNPPPPELSVGVTRTGDRHTVDGRNPAPLASLWKPLFVGSHGGISFQGLLGGAGFRPSTVCTHKSI